MTVARDEIEDFLFTEAELLDDRRLDEWLDLFDPEGVYWIPLDPDSDPLQDPSIVYDDSAGREARVYQLLHQPHWSQMPPSHTIHAISNIRIGATESDGVVPVRCNLMIAELRSGGGRALQYGLGNERVIAAQCLYRLLRRGDRWSIKMKKVMLINHDQPLENLTFFI